MVGNNILSVLLWTLVIAVIGCVAICIEYNSEEQFPVVQVAFIFLVLTLIAWLRLAGAFSRLQPRTIKNSLTAVLSTMSPARPSASQFTQGGAAISALT